MKPLLLIKQLREESLYLPILSTDEVIYLELKLSYQDSDSLTDLGMNINPPTPRTVLVH